jgi:DNA-binding response OmpR family regulator
MLFPGDSPLPTAPQSPSAANLDASRWGAVSIYLLERNAEVAGSMRTMWGGVGLPVKTFLKTAELESALSDSLPDVLVLSEGEASDIFELTNRIRHSLIGASPFVVILLLLTANNADSASATLKSGADSAFVKPITSGQLIERLTQLAFKRKPFIAITDYIGPERRGSGRPSDIPLVQTVNTLRHKLEGRNINSEALQRAIVSAASQLWQCKLRSQGLRLKSSYDQISKASAAQEITAALSSSSVEMVTVLEEAAETAQKIQLTDMVNTCLELAKEVRSLAEGTSTTEVQKVQTLSTIPTIFEHARRLAGKRRT